MGAPRVRTAGRRYFIGDPATAFDPDLLACSDAAYRLLFTAMAHITLHGTDGTIPAEPRKVQMFAQLEGGPESARAAMNELIAEGFLEPTDDPARLLLVTWMTQPDVGTGNKPASRRSSGQLRRAHRAGSHAAEARPGCPECEADGGRAQCANGDAQETPTLTVVPDAPADEPEPAPARAAKPGGMSEVLADLQVSLDAAVAEAETPVAAYREALETADAIAQHPEVASRSKDARSSLRNAVLAHALTYYLGDAASRAVIGAANRGAKALGPDGHWWYVVAAAKAAGRSFESERKLTGWLATVAQGERAERKAVA